MIHMQYNDVFLFYFRLLRKYYRRQIMYCHLADGKRRGQKKEIQAHEDKVNTGRDGLPILTTSNSEPAQVPSNMIVRSVHDNRWCFAWCEPALFDRFHRLCLFPDINITYWAKCHQHACHYQRAMRILFIFRRQCVRYVSLAHVRSPI